MAGQSLYGARRLQGAERRELRVHVAISRAYFEREYEGRRIVPCDRAYVRSVVRRHLGLERGDADTVYVSDAFVREVQRAVPRWREVIDRQQEEE